MLRRLHRQCYPERTVQMMLVALSQADFIGFVEHFNEQFTFVDHAIELGLKEKQHLIDFLILNRELFPNSKKQTTSSVAVVTRS